MGTKVTRLQAVEYAISFMKDNNADNQAVIQVLENMATQLAKHSSKPSGKTQARKNNEASAMKLVDIVRSKDVQNFDAKFVRDSLTFVDTTQKATSVIRVGIDMGLFKKVNKPKQDGTPSKKFVYTLVN